jgi:hypothetical protein
MEEYVDYIPSGHPVSITMIAIMILGGAFIIYKFAELTHITREIKKLDEDEKQKSK